MVSEVGLPRFLDVIVHPAMQTPTKFKCPNCDAEYEVVRIEALPRMTGNWSALATADRSATERAGLR